MKPKHALVKDGFLPKGSENVRGRLSLAAKNRLAELVAMGWDIEGFSINKATAAVEKRPKNDPNTVIDIPDESRSEFLWRAYAGGREIGMRTACNTCKASLTYCRCQSPRVWLDYDREVMVVFKPRKN